MVPFWRQLGTVSVESQATHIHWGIAHFKLDGRRVGVEHYAKMCGAAAVVHNLLAAGLNTNVLEQGIVTAFVQSTRTMPAGAVVRETIFKLTSLPDIAPEDVVTHGCVTFDWYRQLVQFVTESKISLAVGRA